MTTKTFVVPNISCEHCAHTIKMELEDLTGVSQVDADVESRRVTVEYAEPANWDEIEATLVEINYPPQG